VLAAEPVRLAVVPAIGVAVLTVIVTPVGVPGAAMTVTAALPETVDVGSVAVTVGLPAEVPVNWAPLSVVSAVIVPLPDVVQVNDGCVASTAPFWSKAVASNCCVAPTSTVGDAGETVIVVRSGVLATTVRLIVVVLVSVPSEASVPVIVTVLVPVVAEGPAVKVTVLVSAVGFVPKVAVTPVGRPDAVSVTSLK
jgi:hypothetical protein